MTALPWCGACMGVDDVQAEPVPWDKSRSRSRCRPCREREAADLAALEAAGRENEDAAREQLEHGADCGFCIRAMEQQGATAGAARRLCRIFGRRG